MIDKDMPLVSIVIPVYNGSNYLQEAIDSAIGQTYQNIEIIVINDGSNDDGKTEKIARSYGNRIRYYEKENGGVASALNLGISKMSGEYFSWLSHDDRYRKGKIERQIRALMECDDRTRVALGGYVNFTDQDGIVEKMDFLRRYSKKQMETPLFAVFHRAVHGCALLIHRSHFERVGVFKSELRTTQDYDLWFRMMRGQRILYTGGMEVESRFHDGQGSRQLGREHVDACNTLWIHMFESLTAEERIAIGGSEYAFYKGLYHDMLEETDYDEAIRYLHCKLIKEVGIRIQKGDKHSKFLLRRHFKLPENVQLNAEIEKVQQGKEKPQTAIVTSKMEYIKELLKNVENDCVIYKVLFRETVNDEEIYCWREEIEQLADWLALKRVDSVLTSDEESVCGIALMCSMHNIKVKKFCKYTLKEQLANAKSIFRWYNEMKATENVIWSDETSMQLYNAILDNGIYMANSEQIQINDDYQKTKEWLQVLFCKIDQEGAFAERSFNLNCKRMEATLSWRITKPLRQAKKMIAVVCNIGVIQTIRRLRKKHARR